MKLKLGAEGDEAKKSTTFAVKSVIVAPLGWTTRRLLDGLNKLIYRLI